MATATDACFCGVFVDRTAPRGVIVVPIALLPISKTTRPLSWTGHRGMVGNHHGVQLACFDEQVKRGISNIGKLAHPGERADTYPGEKETSRGLHQGLWGMA
jgi:hypothetical protein